MVSPDAVEAAGDTHLPRGHTNISAVLLAIHQQAIQQDIRFRQEEVTAPQRVRADTAILLLHHLFPTP